MWTKIKHGKKNLTNEFCVANPRMSVYIGSSEDRPRET